MNFSMPGNSSKLDILKTPLILSVHSPHFDFDEGALTAGVALMAETARLAIDRISGKQSEKS